jgi:diguanylate cyclase (GGDEF)-like protein
MSEISLSQLRRAADARAATLARRFGDALHIGEGAVAERVIDDALSAGMTPAAVQSLVIGPAMVRLGELWVSGVITVADEHLATSISHRALIRLFERMSAGHIQARSRERILLAAVEGQHHVLGLRMIADTLEGAGFDVLYLGADVPVASLRTILARHRPAVVGLAFGIAADVSCLADSLYAIHEHASQTRVMLGGRAVPPALRECYAHVVNSMEVVDVVDALLAAPPPRQLAPIVDQLRSTGTRSAIASEHGGDTDPVAESLAKAAEQAVDIAREHIRRAEAFRELAVGEPLAHVVSRRGFEDRLSTLVQEPAGAGAALLVIDIDRFKAIIEEHGHRAGDELVHAIGQSISGSVRSGDVVAHFGGDDFAVLMPAATVPRACEMGDRIRAAAIARAGPVSVSIGVAALAGDARAALLAAQTALWEAKTSGRDRVVASHGWPHRAGDEAAT